MCGNSEIFEDYQLCCFRWCRSPVLELVKIRRTDASKKILLNYYKYLEDPKYFEDLKRALEFPGQEPAADHLNNITKHSKDPFRIV